jgi:hypothetical protein
MAPLCFGVVKSLVLLRDSMFPSLFSVLFGYFSSKALRCSLFPFNRSSSLLLFPANKMRPSLVDKLSKHVIESSLLASISAKDCTVGAREVKSNAVIWFLTPDRPA